MAVERCLGDLVRRGDCICVYHVDSIQSFQAERKRYNPSCASQNANAFRSHKRSHSYLCDRNPEVFWHPGITFCRECEKNLRHPKVTLQLDDDDAQGFDLNQGFDLPYGKDDAEKLDRVTV